MAQQNSQWQNREHGKDKVQRVRFMVQFLCRERNRDEYEQPKQRVPADLSKEQLHGDACSVYRIGRAY